MIPLDKSKMYYGDIEVNNIYLGDNLIYGEKPVEWVLATDEDFSGARDGAFKYIGSDDYIIMPHEIKGVKLTSYNAMFAETDIKGVQSDNKNITHMVRTFSRLQSSTLNLDNFDTSNVDTFYQIFEWSNIISLNLGGFDTSNVTDMRSLLSNSEVRDVNLSSFNISKTAHLDNAFRLTALEELDLTSFDFSNKPNIDGIFARSDIRTVYTRTKEDADYLNSARNSPEGIKFIVKE